MKRVNFKKLNIVIFRVVTLSLLILFTGCRFFQSSNIHTVQNLDLLEQEIPKLDSNSLVVFDVDDTLITMKDHFERGNDLSRRQNRAVISFWQPGSPLSQELDLETRERLWTIYRLANEEVIIDPKSPQLIKEMLNKGVKVLALTDIPVDKYGVIDNMQDFRVKELLDVGIDFSSSFDIKKIVFDQFLSGGKAPIFYKGVLITSFLCSKGGLLAAFLDKANFKPSRVIAVDDKLEKLEGIERELKKMSVPFMGLHYVVIENSAQVFDKKLAEFQTDYLIKHEKWLSFKRAKEMVEIEGCDQLTFMELFYSKIGDILFFFRCLTLSIKGVLFSES